MIEVIPVKSIANLISETIKLQKSKENTFLWFRGEREAGWELKPHVYRKGYSERDESNLIHRFRARAGSRYPNVPDYRNFALWLSLMQHYGLPTRLLDWSRSPLVAAYFAIESQIYNPPSDLKGDFKDAAIWVLQPHDLNRIESIKHSEATPSIETEEVKPLITPAFKSNETETNQVLAVMASEHDLRMFIQQGCFTIHSDRTALNLRKEPERYLTMFQIPRKSIKSFAKQVETCGLRKGDIYPDLEHLAAELQVQRGK